jgi:hypothetical protein
MADLAFVLFDTVGAWDDRGALARFRRALRRADQLVLDDMLAPLLGQPGLPSLENNDPCLEPALFAVLLGEQKRLVGIQEGLRQIAALQIIDG